MNRTEEIAANVAGVRERITAAARRAGRDPLDVTLIAVSKTHPAELVEAVAASGVRDFGENRVAEGAEKAAALYALDLHWHLIGHLQRNKVRRAVGVFALVHSVDSVRLAEALDRVVREGAPGRRQPILLQVNIAGEEQKEGFDLAGGIRNAAALEEFYAVVEQIAPLEALEIHGLMTIAPYVENAEEVRPVFAALRELRDGLAARFPALAWRELSMGMTGDFEVAVEEGATLVRVGRAIFGERG